MLAKNNQSTGCCCENCSKISIKEELHKEDLRKEESQIENDAKNTAGTIAFAAGLVLFVGGILLQEKVLLLPLSIDSTKINHLATFAVCFISYLLIGKNVILNVFKNLGKGIIFDENFLMTIATVGAFAIGEYPEAAAVMLFYRIGEGFEERAVKHSKKSIKSLLDIRPDYANLKLSNGVLKKVDPTEVAIGSLILVSPGEKIPIDGIIVEGTSSLDTRALTGESMPRDVSVDDAVISGSINTTGTLTVRTTHSAGDSTVTKILELVENSENQKAKAENFITKFARYYTPVVVISATLLALIPIFILGLDPATWVKRALIFLVVSCPCALVISVPLSFFGGLGQASKNGILIKGGNFLEALHNIDTVVFDKTGTLTKGEFKVSSITPYGNYTKDQLLYYCAQAEKFSKHPTAISICEYESTCEYERENQTQANVVNSSIQELPGFGVSADVDGKKVFVGNKKLMQRENITSSVSDFETANKEGGLPVYVAIDGEYAGCIKLSDELKETSIETISYLKKRGINTLMLSGDRMEHVKEFASKCGIKNYKSDLLPQEKLEILNEVLKNKKDGAAVVFVGDGINDAPSIASADIGIAIGAFGTDAAMEAADIVLMNGEPITLKKAFDIAAKTHTIVMQNIVFALGVKAAILSLGALGMASIWLAVFGDVGVTFIAVLNSIRNLRYRRL